jgi:putative ABC transport system permease protein
MWRWRKRTDEDFSEEIRANIALDTDRFIAEGISPEEARSAALRAFGNVTRTQERFYDSGRVIWLDDLQRDVRYACRTFAKSLGFTVVAVLTLALGIGANTAIFSLVDALLLRRLPVRDPQQLVSLYRIQGGQSGGHFSYPQVSTLAERNEVFASVCGYSDGTTLNVGPADALEPTGNAWISGACYQTLGLLPVAGRLLTPEDDRTGAPPAAVISDSYWARKFGRDPQAIGQLLLIEGKPVAVVGVTAPGYEGPTVGEAAHITLAIAVLPQLQPERASIIGPGGRWLSILARPRSGLSRDQVQAGASVAWAQIVSGGNNAIRASTLDVRSGATGTSPLRSQYRQSLLVLMGVVALVLAIACANVASLLLARATVRQREISVRLAIGAGRARIIRQLLTESALLSASGAALGIVFASWGSRFLVEMISGGIRIDDASVAGAAFDLALNWRVLTFTSVIAVTTTLLVGLTPAFSSTREAPTLAMNLASNRLLGPRGRLGAALVTTQIAFSLLLLIGAGLFVRTLQNLRTYDRGFRHEDVLLVGIDPRRAGYRDVRLQAFNREALAFAERLPGVTVASASAITPLMGGGISVLIAINGRPIEGEEFHFNLVAPRYFEGLQTPVVLGRDFTPTDDATAPMVAIVNETFVRKYLPDGAPLGQRVSMAGEKADRLVVGVVRDAVYENLRQSPPPTVYEPLFQVRAQPMTLVVYAPGSIGKVASAIRAELEPRLAGVRLSVRTLTAQLEGGLAQERLMARLAGIFGALALLLASVGLYGLLAYTVARRTSEIGIRLALGAQRAQVLQLVLSDAAWMLVFGALLGIPAAWGAMRVVSSMLFRVTATDPATIAAALTVLMATGLVAAYVPARRATRVDPMVALRCE